MVPTEVPIHKSFAGPRNYSPEGETLKTTQLVVAKVLWDVTDDEVFGGLNLSLGLLRGFLSCYRN